MTTHFYNTENYLLDSALTLRDRTNTPLTVRAIALSLTKIKLPNEEAIVYAKELYRIWQQ